MKQNLEKVKDHNIGIGLACSKSIVNSLNGEIKINKSINGFTSFSFMFPVKTQTFSSNSCNIEQLNIFKNKLMYKLNIELQTYMKSLSITSFYKLEVSSDI